MEQEQRSSRTQALSERKVLKQYLTLLESSRKRSTRKTDTTDDIKSRLALIAQELTNGVTPLRRLKLYQERRNLERELIVLAAAQTMERAEEEAVKVLAHYSERHGINRATWREAGVPRKVLDRAGVAG